MKDILNREIQLNDKIFYGTTSRYPEFAVLRVVEINEKTILAQKLISNRDKSFSFMNGKDIRIRAGSHCIIINKEMENEN